MQILQMVVAKLHKKYGIGESANYLVPVGDQKTYNRIRKLKQECGSELDCLVQYNIGDLYLVSNYQYVLVKVYYDAGLKDLAVCWAQR